MYAYLRLSKCGLGEEWRNSAGQNIKQMKKYWKRLEKKDPSYMYAQKNPDKRSGSDTLLEENHC